MSRLRLSQRCPTPRRLIFRVTVSPRKHPRIVTDCTAVNSLWIDVSTEVGFFKVQITSCKLCEVVLRWRTEIRLSLLYLLRQHQCRVQMWTWIYWLCNFFAPIFSPHVFNLSKKKVLIILVSSSRSTGSSAAIAPTLGLKGRLLWSGLFCCIFLTWHPLRYIFDECDFPRWSRNACILLEFFALDYELASMLCFLLFHLLKLWWNSSS